MSYVLRNLCEIVDFYVEKTDNINTYYLASVPYQVHQLRYNSRRIIDKEINYDR